MSTLPASLSTLALMTACGAGPARADCVDGTREPRPAELEFHRRATAALAAALPPAPAAVRTEGDGADLQRLPTLGVLCKEQKQGEFRVGVSRRYELPMSEAESRRQAAARREIDDQILALLKIPPDLAAEREALSRQSLAAESLRQAALKSGDKAGADARMAEVNRCNEAYFQIGKKHEAAVKPQVDALKDKRKAYETDGQRAGIGLAINLTQLPAASANPGGAYGAASPDRSAKLVVNNVVWSVAGTDTPLRKALVDALDKAWLQGLVGKAPPPETASQALAAKAQPQALPLTLAMPAEAGITPAAAAPAAPGPVTAAAQVPAQAPAPAPVAAPPPASGAPAKDAAEDTAKKTAKDAVNQLRGLFGR
jgi:hypothetical protein